MIRKGRNTSMDQLFTIIVLLAVVAGVIGAFVVLAKKNPGGGMFWQHVAIDEVDEIEPLKMIRIPVPIDEESMKASKIVIQMEVDPTGSEVDFGLVYAGKELREGNLVGERLNKSVVRAPASRRITVSDSAPPGRYEVVIKNLSDRKTNVSVRVILKKS